MIAAFCWPQSVLPAQQVAIRCSTSAPHVRIQVVRQGMNDEIVFECDVRGAEHALPDDAARRGCDWPDLATLTVGSDWRSGFYVVRCTAEDGEQAEAFFVVRAATPGRTLLVLSTSTWAAYNDWGGPSYYTGGGRAAFFSGNTAFWQIRYEDDHRMQVSYKVDIAEDPVYGTERQQSLATMWSDPVVGRPENAMTGVSFSRGGYAHLDNAPHGTGGYTVWRPQHWAFEGLALRAGDVVGSEPVVVGYECDGCELTLENGLPVPTHRDGTPAGFEVLASAPAHLWETRERPGALPDRGSGELNWVAERLAGGDTPENRERFAYGYAVMGAFARGEGEVFTTGCTDWAFGLDDPGVAAITRNVLRHFLAGTVANDAKAPEVRARATGRD